MSKRLNSKTKLATLGTIASSATLPTVGVSAALIAVGVLSSFPITSVFAATGTTVTDTVEVTIDSACTITTTNLSNTYSATMTNGQLKSDFGSTNMTINCNDAGGWHLTAVGTGADASDKTVMNATSTGTDIATGTATSGNTSNWAMKVTGTGATGFTTFQPIPSVATNVAGDSNPVANATLNTTYQVFISSTQQADTYTGQVTYTLAHPYEDAPPPLYMQDVDTWGSSLQAGNEITVKDRRDGKSYTVARLADGNIWMTKNLDLAGGTEITSELSNVPDNYTLPTANGFGEGNKLPASSTSGFNDETKAFVYNSTKTSGTDCSSPGCYSYYSWTAATAGSGLSIRADNTDAPYSICPKGWKLPSTRTTDVADWKTESDFYQLAVAYGMDPGGTSQDTSNFFSQAGPGTTPNFLLTGYYYGSSLSVSNSYGLYWSSTSGSSSTARRLLFGSSRVASVNDDSRRSGSAVRCIAE